MSDEPQPGTSTDPDGWTRDASAGRSTDGSPAGDGAAANRIVWTIDVRDLKVGKRPTPLKRGAMAANLVARKEAALAAKKGTERVERDANKPEGDDGKEQDEFNEPTQPALSENEKKMFERVQELRETKKSLMDPKIDMVASKPKIKAPKLTLDKARTHMITLFQSDGSFFQNEEQKLIEWYSTFDTKFDFVTPVHQFHPPKYTFEKAAFIIKGLISGTWQDQVQGLRMLRALAMEISYEPRAPENEAKMMALLRDIYQYFEGCLAEDRTQLMTETCVTIAFLCREYRNKIDTHYLKIMISNLLHKTHIVNLSGYMVKATLKYIFQYVHHHSLFLHLIHEFEKTQGAKAIITIAFLIMYVFEFWTLEEVEPCLDAFEATFMKLYVFDVKCHIPLRMAVWILNRDLPERAKKIYEMLEDLDQLLMAASKFLPPRQAPQEELCPPVVRERPLLIDEIKSDEEEKKKKQEQQQQPQPQPVAVKAPEETKKDKKKKKKKGKKRRSTLSSSSSSSFWSDNDSSSSSLYSRRQQRRRKKMIQKELKKLQKMKKLKKPRASESDSSVDIGLVLAKKSKAKKTNYLLSLKTLPSKFMNLLGSKRSSRGHASIEGRSGKSQVDEQKRKSSSEEVPVDVIARYKKARAEVICARERLRKLEEEHARAQEELQALINESEEYDRRIQRMEEEVKVHPGLKPRSKSDPEQYCKKEE